tara:strand:- start:81171 stop:81725 length:555 start_codon:yes stop_codon:yes gene_type:complete
MILKEISMKQSELDSWRMPGMAPIVSIEKLSKEVKSNYIVATSGGYDPIHPGHISCMLEASKLNKVLVVIVNGDWFLKNKKGKAFQDLKARCQIVASIACVDYVVPFPIEGDKSVSQAIEQMRPFIFAKGGDRTDAQNIAEWETCEAVGTRIVTGVGHPKHWSSSDFLKDWGEFVKKGFLAGNR